MRYEYVGINNDYYPVSYEEYRELVDVDEETGEEFYEEVRDKIVVNKEHNQSIIFREYRFEDEEKLDDVAMIPNYTGIEAYAYIGQILNTHDNITVVWSQVFGTSSNYQIVFGHCFTSKEEYNKYLETHQNNLPYKYIENDDTNWQKCF